MNYLTLLLVALLSFQGKLNAQIAPNNIPEISIEIVKTANGFDALNISFDVNAKLETFISVIDDVSSYQSWVYRSLGSKQLPSKNNGIIVYESKFDFPFPLTDRILNVECRQNIDSNGIFYSESKLYTEQPNDQNYVNITHFESKWKVYPNGKNGLHVEYFVSSEPGGIIPSFIYNLAVSEGPTKTIQNLIAKVESVEKSHKKYVEIIAK